jgi:hypothetical protein
MKNIITIILLLISQTSIGQFNRQEAVYFATGVFVSGVVNYSVYEITKDKDKAFMYGMLSGLGVGLCRLLIEDNPNIEGLRFTTLGVFAISFPMLAVEGLLSIDRKINTNL